MGIEIYANLLRRNRWSVALFVIVMSAVAIEGHRIGPPPTWRPNPRTNDEEFTESEHSHRMLSQWENESDDFEFPENEAFLVVSVENLFCQSSMETLRDVVAGVRSLEQVDSIVWIDDVPILNFFGVTEPILPPSGSTDGDYLAVKAKVLQHPLLKGQLISPDGQMLLMPIAYDWPFVSDDSDCTEKILEEAHKHLAVDSDIQIRITGDVPIYLAAKQALDRNHFKFQIIGYSLALVVTIVLFRGVASVIIVSAAPAIAIFWCTGFLNLVSEQTNDLTNVILPVLISMVGLTDGIHLMMHIRRVKAAGATPIEAATHSIRKIGLACALTSLTTAIGFGSLMLSQHEYIQSFGRTCAIGVMFSFLSVITVIPLMATLPFAKNVHHGFEKDLVGRNLDIGLGVLNWIIRRPKRVSVFAIILTLGLSGIALTLRPDYFLKTALPSNSEISEAILQCDQAMGGIELAHIEVRWRNPEIDRLTVLDVIEQVENLLPTEPLLQHPVSIRDLLDTFPLQEESESARASFLDLIPPPLKRLFFDEDQLLATLTVRIQDSGIAQYKPVFDRLVEKFQGIEANYPDFEIALEGQPVNRANELHQMVSDLATSLGTAAGIIFVVLAFVYRSLRLGLISLIPNMFPLVVTGSVLVLMGGALDFASVCAFTVCLGIAVDDTIHFLTRYRQEFNETKELRPAIRNTFLEVGSALVVTTIILVLGFGTALTSDLPDHRMFAGMACATIGSALIGDLLFLPAMLICFRKRDARNQSEAFPSRPDDNSRG